MFARADSVRSQLNPKVANEALALETRDRDESLRPYRFLFSDYKLNRWYFEIVDLYRRIFFIGVLPLISADPANRAYIGCGLALVSAIYFREMTPFRIPFTNFVAVVAQYSILVTFMAALILETDSLEKFGIGGFGLGVLLCSVNGTIIFLAFFVGWKRYRYERRAHRQGSERAAD